MKKKISGIILGLALILAPLNAHAEEVPANKDYDKVTITVEEKTDKDKEIREKIKIQLKETKSKLAGLKYIKEKMPNTTKRYQAQIDKAEKKAEAAIKAAEEFLYGKKEEPKGDKEIGKSENNSNGNKEDTKDKPKDTSGDKNTTGSSGGFKDPASPAYLVAKGRIIGNVNSKIYHMPDGASYKKVSIENAVFFNSAKEAESAGYRRALR